MVKIWHGGAAETIAASQLQGLLIESVLGLLSVQGFPYMCSSCLRGFPSFFVFSSTDCVNVGANSAAGIPSRMYFCLMLSVPRICLSKVREFVYRCSDIQTSNIINSKYPA